MYQVRLEDLHNSHLLTDSSGTFLSSSILPPQPACIIRPFALLRSCYRGRLDQGP
jgi:hypothetical protein